jgi:hypothetical protein
MSAIPQERPCVGKSWLLQVVAQRICGSALGEAVTAYRTLKSYRSLQKTGM